MTYYFLMTQSTGYELKTEKIESKNYVLEVDIWLGGMFTHFEYLWNDGIESGSFLSLRQAPGGGRIGHEIRTSEIDLEVPFEVLQMALDDIERRLNE